ncbi:hypothetical protein [Sporolactobacillus putidus]|uniref:Uncharacterized protein n=1 Tax=Sporolactobacillus putidus TaxID=492735 RepID=A0A917S3R1_9BACL|nr:hypothetical protein [Sporolactobacillus putidus]GGL55810.1 hypothetical protein GCM10007968_19870 [Sporolactobacillus putidus]
MDLTTQLKKVEKQINDNLKNVNIEDLFNDEFIKQHTDFSSYDEFKKEAAKSYTAKKIKELGY